MDPEALELLHALERVAEPELNARLARLEELTTWGEGVWRIVPVNPRACDVTVSYDYPEQLTLFLGRHQTTCELFDKNRARLLADTRDLIRAAIDGRYRERVRLAGTKLGKAKATFQLAHGPRRFSYSNLGTIGDRGPWLEVEYEPYGAAAEPLVPGAQ